MLQQGLVRVQELPGEMCRGILGICIQWDRSSSTLSFLGATLAAVTVVTCSAVCACTSHLSWGHRGFPGAFLAGKVVEPKVRGQGLPFQAVDAAH